jgi:hypothetical protein
VKQKKRRFNKNKKFTSFKERSWILKVDLMSITFVRITKNIKIVVAMAKDIL